MNRPEAFTVYRAEPAPAAPASLPPSPRARTTAPPQSLPPHPPARVTGRVPEVKPRRAWQPLRRSVTDLPRRAEVSQAANRRYLDALASTQVGTPLGQAAAPLCRPVTHEGRRYRALHPLNSSDAALLRALSRGEWTMAGLRNRDLQRLLYVSEPWNHQAALRRSAAVGRKLRLLRAHGLLRKVPHTHRYLVTESGRAVLTALVAAQEASTEKLTLALAAWENRRDMKQFPAILIETPLLWRVSFSKGTGLDSSRMQYVAAYWQTICNNTLRDRWMSQSASDWSRYYGHTKDMCEEVRKRAVLLAPEQFTITGAERSMGFGYTGTAVIQHEIHRVRPTLSLGLLRLSPPGFNIPSLSRSFREMKS